MQKTESEAHMAKNIKADNKICFNRKPGRKAVGKVDDERIEGRLKGEMEITKNYLHCIARIICK